MATVTTPATVTSIPTHSNGLTLLKSCNRITETIAVTDTAPPNTIGITSNAFPLLVHHGRVVKQRAPAAPSVPARNPHFIVGKCAPVKLKLSPLTFIMTRPPDDSNDKVRDADEDIRLERSPTLLEAATLGLPSRLVAFVHFR